MSQEFRNIVVVVTKGKNKKIKIRKICLFLLSLVPSQDGGVVAIPDPHPPQLFSRQFFFADTWVSGPRAGELIPSPS